MRHIKLLHSILAATLLLAGANACSSEEDPDNHAENVVASGAGGSDDSEWSDSDDGDFGDDGTSEGGDATCAEACSTIYTCGEKEDRCPGWSTVPAASFSPACEAACKDNPAIKSLASDDCSKTVDSLKEVNSDFKQLCEEGGPELSCEEACSAIYTCGEKRNNCPGWSTYPASSFNPVCVDACKGDFPSIKSLPTSDCAETINATKDKFEAFKQLCEEGA